MRGGGRPFIWAACLLGGLYILTRLGSLAALPIFLDEAVHIQWAERLYAEGRVLRPIAAGRLIGVVAYGPAPAFADQLLAARVVATLAGALTLAFTVLLARQLFGPRAGVLAGALYILSPFALVYDRLALSDGFLSASLTALMFATAKLMVAPERRSLRVWVALLLALSVAAKVSALLFLLTLPLAGLALSRPARPALTSLSMAGGAGLLAASPILWLFAASGAEVQAQHVVDPRVAGPLIFSTLGDMSGWLQAYFGRPALLMAVASMAMLRNRRALWLGGSVVVPIGLFALLSEPWSARYILPVLPPFLILLSGGIEAFSERVGPSRKGVVAMALLVLAVSSALPFNWRLLSDPARAPYPADDRHQLVTGWPSGYGIRELAARLKAEAAQGPLFAYVDTGGTRTASTSLAILLAGDPRVRLIEVDFGSPELPEMLAQAGLRDRAFAILGPRTDDVHLDSLPDGARAERVEVYERPGGEWAATLFRIRFGALESLQ